MLTRLLAATVLSRNVAVQHETLVTNVTSKALSWALVGERGKCRSLCAEAGCLPLRFVLGAQKAATTALWRLLITTALLAPVFFSAILRKAHPHCPEESSA